MTNKKKVSLVVTTYNCKENFLKTADTYIKFMEEILLKGMWHTYMQMVKS